MKLGNSLSRTRCISRFSFSNGKTWFTNDRALDFNNRLRPRDFFEAILDILVTMA